MKTNYLQKLAKLAVQGGVNVQNGQTVVLNSPIEAAELARAISREAYAAGAKEVIIRYSDEQADHDRYLMADPAIFEDCPAWKAVLYNDTAENGACYIHIDGGNPSLMADINPSYPASESKAMRKKAALYRSRIDKGQAAWSIVPFAHPAWAKAVYPRLDEKAAVEQLWSDLFKVCRIDENDPLENWKKHNESFQNRKKKLNELHLKSLHYKNSLGTDLIVELPENYRFEGGSSVLDTGIRFFPNIPTEELFTAPLKTGVNGTVKASMPLSHSGTLIENISLTFKDGKVADYSASSGKDALKAILETDENSCCLGEAALVPAGSPIQSLHRIFYNTLIDENASCHLALGQSYGECIENGLTMTPDELEKLGMNQSAAHVDFMIGTDDLNITGLTADGQEVPIFVNGKYADWIDQKNQ